MGWIDLRDPLTHNSPPAQWINFKMRGLSKLIDAVDRGTKAFESFNVNIKTIVITLAESMEALRILSIEGQRQYWRGPLWRYFYGN